MKSTLPWQNTQIDYQGFWNGEGGWQGSKDYGTFIEFLANCESRPEAQKGEVTRQFKD